jgi:hypothetical protein
MKAQKTMSTIKKMESRIKISNPLGKNILSVDEIRELITRKYATMVKLTRTSNNFLKKANKTMELITIPAILNISMVFCRFCLRIISLKSPMVTTEVKAIKKARMPLFKNFFSLPFSIIF